MKGRLNIIIKNLQNKITIEQKRLRKIILNVLSSEEVNKCGEITVCLINDKQIKELNLRYLGHNSPTDVISFNNSIGKEELLADIAVSAQTAICNARIFKRTPVYEVYLYVIHGLLHIIGYGDKTPKQRKIMEAKANLYLSKYVNTQDRSHSFK